MAFQSNGVTGTLSLELIKESNLLDGLEMRIAKHLLHVELYSNLVHFHFIVGFQIHIRAPIRQQQFISPRPKIGAFALISRLFLDSLNVMSEFGLY